MAVECSDDGSNSCLDLSWFDLSTPGDDLSKKRGVVGQIKPGRNIQYCIYTFRCKIYGALYTYKGTVVLTEKIWVLLFVRCVYVDVDRKGFIFIFFVRCV